MPFKGFLNLQSPRDLFEKSCRDFDQLKKDPCDQDAAFDFFLTARHLPDWLYPDAQGKENREKRAALEKSSPLLQVCAHIADGSKHFQTTAQKHHSVQETVVEEGAFQSDAFQSDAVQVGTLIIRLDSQAAKALGVNGEIECVELARMVVEFWQHYFKKTEC